MPKCCLNVCGIRVGLRSKKMKLAWGKYRRNAREIVTDPRDPCPLATLLHETIHAIFYALPLLRRMVPKRWRDDFIDTLATALADTLVRNGMVSKLRGDAE